VAGFSCLLAHKTDIFLAHNWHLVTSANSNYIPQGGAQNGTYMFYIEHAIRQFWKMIRLNDPSGRWPR